MRLLLAVLLALLTTLASAAEWKVLSGRVVGVVDGDTIDVLDSRNTTRRIRLMGIDAPEKRQPFGTTAKHHLADLVFGRDVEIRWRKLDNRQKRIVGQVLISNRDVNLQMISAGLAWWFAAFQREQLPADRRIYSDAEASARQQRAGLWADPDPVPPWDWRRGQR